MVSSFYEQEKEQERERPFCGAIINTAYPAGLFSNVES